MDGSVLFIRADDNKFEEFFTENIRLKGFEVSKPYTVPMEKIYDLPFVDRIRFRRCPPFIYDHLIADWKHLLSNYKTIIIFDKALTIQLLRYIRKYNSTCAIKIWLWNRRPLEAEVKKYAQVYTFDKEYAELNGFTYIPQFHFENVFQNTGKPDTGVFYTGFDKDRKDELSGIARMLNELNIKHKLILRKDQNRYYEEDGTGIIFTDNDLPYYYVLNQMKSYSCILELNMKEQTGITLRALEALFGNRKLITNNKRITDYDFYSPDNIFVLGCDDPARLTDFVSSEPLPVAEHIKYSYTFDAWVTRITGQ